MTAVRQLGGDVTAMRVVSAGRVDDFVMTKMSWYPISDTKFEVGMAKSGTERVACYPGF
jgi:hypothetical protein